VTDRLRIEGGVSLNGSLTVGGAKNAALPSMVASVLSDQPVRLCHVPKLDDVKVMETVLRAVGVETEHHDEEWQLSASSLHAPKPHALEAMKRMRAGILLLGPLAARLGKASLPMPGGDPIGKRPIGYHLAGLEKMGGLVERSGEHVSLTFPHPPQAIEYEFPGISVGATEALIMSASLAKGRSILKNVALEPEILDLIAMLRTMGASIEHEAHRTLIVEGAEGVLSGCTHAVMRDRIECGSYAIATIASQGKTLLKGGSLALLGESVSVILTSMGAKLEDVPHGLEVTSHMPLKATRVLTAPWPGFATDLQAQLTVLCTQSEGESSLEETVFEDRFQQVDTLIAMGARIQRQGNLITIQGPTPLHQVDEAIAHDIRASFSLVIAALIAQGTTLITDAGHLKRGYENLVPKLQSLGALASWEV
jgi:UDP-N-acetylglucosamine 1-carboxyvinyltransferase